MKQQPHVKYGIVHEHEEGFRVTPEEWDDDLNMIRCTDGEGNERLFTPSEYIGQMEVV